MLPEKRIEKVLPPSKISGAKAHERGNQVNNSTTGSEIKNAQCAGYFKSLFARYCRTSSIVDKNKIGRD